MKKAILITIILIIIYILFFVTYIDSGMEEKISVLENVLNKSCGDSSYDMVCYQKSIKGKLSYDDKEKLMNKLTNYIEGEIVDKTSRKENDMWIIYGYTEKINSSIKVSGEDINYNIAITYNEENDMTNIYLGSPIINIEF